jgi:hypothetical protein
LPQRSNSRGSVALSVATRHDRRRATPRCTCCADSRGTQAAMSPQQAVLALMVTGCLSSGSPGTTAGGRFCEEDRCVALFLGTCEHGQLQAAQRTHRRTHRAMRFFSWHTHVGNLRGSVVFFGAATTTYVRGSLLSPGPQQWSTFRKPACRTGGDAGAAPAGSTIGLYAQATTREPRRSGLRRLRKQQGEGLAAPSASDLPKCPQAGGLSVVTRKAIGPIALGDAGARRPPSRQ